MTETLETTSDGFVLSGPIYDKMKFVVQVLLPALSTLYFTLGSIWDLPNVEQVVGTLAAIAIFLGVLLGLSSKNYNASEVKYVGDLVPTEKANGGLLYSLEINGDPADILDMSEAIFRVLPLRPHPDNTLPEDLA
jgi:hypothetical protein